MHYVGLDISVARTAVCVMDAAGQLVREQSVASTPEAIAKVVGAIGEVEWIGLEAGINSAWIARGLTDAKLPVIVIDATHAAAALKTGFRNKTDKNDARGIADLMRVNKFRSVSVKSVASQRDRALLTVREQLRRQSLDARNIIWSIDYAYQVGRHRLFDDAIAQDLQEFIRGANPSGSDGNGSPLADPGVMCRRAADTAFGRWKLGNGHDLAVRELSLLAQMTEPAVRNSLSKERIAIGKTGVENATAQAWLGQRRDFVPTRTEEAARDNWVAQSRFLLDQREFGEAFTRIMSGVPLTAAALAKAGVGRKFIDALKAGRPLPDVEKLNRVGLALELDAAHFAGSAVRASLQAETLN